MSVSNIGISLEDTNCKEEEYFFADSPIIHSIPLDAGGWISLTGWKTCELKL